MRAPPPGRAGAGIPREPADDHDTDENVLEVDDADVEEVDSGAVTAATRVCTECSCEVLGIGVIEAPDVNDLVRIPTFWKGCVFSGPAVLPSWWFCARGGDPSIEPGDGYGIYNVAGSFRVHVKRMVTQTPDRQ